MSASIIMTSKKPKAEKAASSHPPPPFKQEPQQEPIRRGRKKVLQRTSIQPTTKGGDRFVDRTSEVNRLMMFCNQQTLASVPWLPHPASLSDELKSWLT